MIFLLTSYNHRINHQKAFGFIAAESPEEAAADPRVGSSIIGTLGGGTQHILKVSGGETMTQWYLEEIEPLTERPPEMNHR